MYKDIRFGVDSVIVDYNNMLKTLSTDLEADYIDTFNPTSTHPEKNSLYFAADGLHLTEKGHLFFAEIILEYLGRHDRGI